MSRNTFTALVKRSTRVALASFLPVSFAFPCFSSPQREAPARLCGHPTSLQTNQANGASSPKSASSFPQACSSALLVAVQGLHIRFKGLSELPPQLIHNGTATRSQRSSSREGPCSQQPTQTLHELAAGRSRGAAGPAPGSPHSRGLRLVCQ